MHEPIRVLFLSEGNEAQVGMHQVRLQRPPGEWRQAHRQFRAGLGALRGRHLEPDPRTRRDYPGAV